MRCEICKKYVGAHGQYNHNMAHVRRGEMTVEMEKHHSEWGSNHVFKVVDVPRPAAGKEKTG